MINSACIRWTVDKGISWAGRVSSSSSIAVQAIFGKEGLYCNMQL